MKPWQARVLEGLRRGRPVTGPADVHIDVTNHCNARCVTCWDHSPLLRQGRTAAWKRRRLPWAAFMALVRDLEAMGSVRAVVLSGMGEPLLHPRIYDMMAEIKARGWHLTVISNLLAANMDRLIASGVDNLLVGVQGAGPDSYAAFHPGWDEGDFFELVARLRRLARAGVRVRHVQVINRDTAPEVVQMVRLGHRLRAERVNFKLASLSGGTEAVAVTPEQLRTLVEHSLPEARALALELGVHTNLELFARQVRAAQGEALATVPIHEVGCAMGYVYTRVTVDQEVLFCCNTEVLVGPLGPEGFAALWRGEAWQGLRDRLARGDYFPGCARCGKFEQNVKWAARRRA